eukprot:2191350-Prymnesium_polylepis.1
MARHYSDLLRMGSATTNLGPASGPRRSGRHGGGVSRSGRAHAGARAGARDGRPGAGDDARLLLQPGHVRDGHVSPPARRTRTRGARSARLRGRSGAAHGRAAPYARRHGTRTRTAAEGDGRRRGDGAPAPAGGERAVRGGQPVRSARARRGCDAGAAGGRDRRPAVAPRGKQGSHGGAVRVPPQDAGELG